MRALELLWPTCCAGCDVVGDGRLCRVCRTHRSPQEVPVPLITSCQALCEYDTGVGRALRRAKYGPDRNLFVTLAELLANGANVLDLEADWIVPAPSPWTRRLQRGFAPGAVLAASLHRATGIPIRHALTVSPGSKQAGLGAEGRRINLAGRLRSRRAVAGRVLLVDDVVTTGSTLTACAAELLGDASRTVSALVLCSAVDRTTTVAAVTGQPHELCDRP